MYTYLGMECQRMLEHLQEFVYVSIQYYLLIPIWYFQILQLNSHLGLLSHDPSLWTPFGLCLGILSHVLLCCWSYCPFLEHLRLQLPLCFFSLIGMGKLWQKEPHFCFKVRVCQGESSYTSCLKERDQCGQQSGFLHHTPFSIWDRILARFKLDVQGISNLIRIKCPGWFSSNKEWADPHSFEASFRFRNALLETTSSLERSIIS